MIVEHVAPVTIINSIIIIMLPPRRGKRAKYMHCIVQYNSKEGMLYKAGGGEKRKKRKGKNGGGKIVRHRKVYRMEGRRVM